MHKIYHILFGEDKQFPFPQQAILSLGNNRSVGKWPNPKSLQLFDVIAQRIVNEPSLLDNMTPSSLAKIAWYKVVFTDFSFHL
jgi:hypothetical protein